MKIVKIPTKCPGCSEDLIVVANLFTAEIEITMKAKPAGYGMKMRLVDRYKVLKGLDKLTTWDGSYRGRAIKAAGKILRVLRKLDDPVSVGIQLINETEELATKQGWPDWNLDSCHKRAGEWLAEKQKAPPRKR